MRLLTLALTLFVMPAAALAKAPAHQSNLTILADASLMLPLSALAREYTNQTGTPLSIITEGETDPAKRIQQGFEAHVLLSGDPTLVTRLAQTGLIDVFGTTSFASTQLALVVPEAMKKDFPISSRISFAALLFSHPELPIYVGDPATPEGLRAQKLTEGREFSHEISERGVIRADNESILQAMEEKPGFGLMLAAEATAEPRVAILKVLPPDISEPMRYDAVVLASESMVASRKFTKFLNGEKARKVFAQYGFGPPPSK